MADGSVLRCDIRKSYWLYLTAGKWLIKISLLGEDPRKSWSPKWIPLFKKKVIPEVENTGMILWILVFKNWLKEVNLCVSHTVLYQTMMNEMMYCTCYLLKTVFQDKEHLIFLNAVCQSFIIRVTRNISCLYLQPLVFILLTSFYYQQLIWTYHSWVQKDWQNDTALVFLLSQERIVRRWEMFTLAQKALRTIASVSLHLLPISSCFLTALSMLNRSDH